MDYDLIIVDYNPLGKFENENYRQKMFVLKDGAWSLLDQFNNILEKQLTENKVRLQLEKETIHYYKGSYFNECLLKKR